MMIRFRSKKCSDSNGFDAHCDGMNRFFQFLLRDAKRGHEHDRIEDRAGKQAVVSGGMADTFAEAFLDWKWGAIGAAEFNAGDHADLPDFVNEWLGGLELAKEFGHQGGFGGQAGECVFTGE